MGDRSGFQAQVSTYQMLGRRMDLSDISRGLYGRTTGVSPHHLALLVDQPMSNQNQAWCLTYEGFISPSPESCSISLIHISIQHKGELAIFVVVAAATLHTS